MWGTSLPEWWGLAVMGTLFGPALLGLAVTGLCGWLVYSRGATGPMAGWGLLVTVLMYAGFFPFVWFMQLLSDAGLIEWTQLKSYLAVPVYVGAWLSVIVGIAVVYLWRRKPTRDLTSAHLDAPPEDSQFKE